MYEGMKISAAVLNVDMDKIRLPEGIDVRDVGKKGVN